MKRPRTLVSLMVERRRLAEHLIRRRAEARRYGLSIKQRTSLLGRTNRPLPRVSIRSLLRLAAQSRAFARSRWTSHDTETYSACGWDDYQLELRGDAFRKATEYRKAARFLYAGGAK